MADIDDLKAAFEQLVTTFNKGDLDAWSAMYHDQAILYLADVPFAVDGKAERQQNVQTFFANHEGVTFTPINPQFRIIGTTGITWGHNAFALKPEDGPVRTEFHRFTLTWTKSGGNWIGVEAHLSRIPSGN